MTKNEPDSHKHHQMQD